MSKINDDDDADDDDDDDDDDELPEITRSRTTDCGRILTDILVLPGGDVTGSTGSF